MRQLKYLIPVLLIIYSCGNNNKPANNTSDSIVVADTPVVDTIFPAVDSLENYENTVFLPTLETPIESNKNAVYAATLLMCWDEIKTVLGSPITDFTSKELERMHNSKSYQNVLKKDEYETTIEYDEELLTVKATAYFRKLLPFDNPLTVNKKPFIFNKKDTVRSMYIGAYTYGTVSMVYYISDDNFAIKLNPNDEQHEIILIKGEPLKQTTLGEVYSAFTKTKDEQISKRTKKEDWRFYINEEDNGIIPMFSYNIKNHFTDIEGSTFIAPNNLYRVIKALQRNAFILNQHGVAVESFARMEIAAAAADPEQVIPPKKTMIFDEPFVIFLKRKDSEYPYYAMYVVNGELMIPYSSEE